MTINLKIKYIPQKFIKIPSSSSLLIFHKKYICSKNHCKYFQREFQGSTEFSIELFD